MQLNEISTNIQSRRNKIFLLMEEVRRLRIQQRLKVSRWEGLMTAEGLGRVALRARGRGQGCGASLGAGGAGARYGGPAQDRSAGYGGRPTRPFNSHQTAE